MPCALGGLLSRISVIKMDSGEGRVYELILGAVMVILRVLMED